MSLSRYSKYKDSGVAWLGDVPGHWTIPKLKHFTSFVGGGTPSRDNLAFWNGHIPWVSPKDMKFERITATEEFLTDTGLSNSSANLLQAGHVLIVVRSGILKHTIPVAINDVPVALNQDMKALKFAESHCLSKFFLRWVQGLNDLLLLDWAKQGATVESIEHTYLAETRVPLPSLEEQSSIVAFLDYETGKIDAVIAEQEKLLTLLAEKRQATISHAVTKGLNPGAQRKDTGSDWLRDVPAHWEVAALKRFWNTIDCKHITAEFVEEGIPLASIREVQNWNVTLDNAKRTTDFFYNQLIDGGRKPIAGDLIFSRNATVGEVAQVTNDHPPFAMGQDVCLLRKIDESYSSDYLQYVIRSAVVIEQLQNLMVGSTFKRVNVEEIRGLLIPTPPPGEQASIVSFLERETAQIDALDVQAAHAIELLRERRTALISAAVTGKIDLRDQLAIQEAA